jgi:hypothetical protein
VSAADPNSTVYTSATFPPFKKKMLMAEICDIIFICRLSRQFQAFVTFNYTFEYNINAAFSPVV